MKIRKYIITLKQNSQQMRAKPGYISPFSLWVREDGVVVQPLQSQHAGADPVVSITGPQAHPRVDSNQRGALLPPRPSLQVRQGPEEDEEAAVPEPGQAGEVDGVEEADLEPGERSPAEEGSLLRVVKEVAEGFPASPVPAGRFDGSSSQ